MAPEKDKKFDAALGGFLVNNLRVRAGHIHCPESDVLAAYHERSLLPEELNFWKEHIVGCARCQAILAQLEATDSIPLQASEKEEVVLAGAAVGVAEPANSRRKAMAAAFPEKSRGSRLSRGLRWQWLAPAGALAAGLLVWVAWHENQPLQVKAPAELKTAKVAQPATPAPAAAQQVPESTSPDQLTSLLKDQESTGREVSPKKQLERRDFKQLEKSDSRAKMALAKPSDKKAGTRQDAGGEASMAADQVQSQLVAEGKPAVPGAAAETAEVQARAASAPIQNEQTQQNQLNAQKTPGPSPLGQTVEPKKNKSASLARNQAAAVPPAAPAPTAAFDENVRASFAVMAGALTQHLISVPGNKILWRVGHAGMIEFSSDGSATWSRQTSNVLVDLTSGSAPSEKVCWIVGRAGSILLTTDAGAHWSTVHSPLEEDLGGVHAVDALHATIWSLRNNKTFETLDGGLTWKPVASQ
jgi:hypothetical protein